MAKEIQTLRVDRSRVHSTIHGERTPGDPHVRAHFQQDGLLFDGQGKLIPELVPEHLKDKVAKKIRKLNGDKSVALPAPEKEQEPVQQVASDESDDEEEDEDEDDDAPASSDDINIESWLKGQANYQWFAVAKAIRQRFNKNVKDSADAVLFLVTEEQVIAPADLAPKFQSFLN